ncbi:MAG: efflux RND transporter periplasmic adaptor subunit [Armatimonadetes bacterium]|nr:efflux RND transporter periplasmic adaptor subunit [Armatimonadota bacterium]
MSVVFTVFLALALGGCSGLGGAPKPTSKPQKVEKGDVTVQVVETGSLYAVKSVQVKSRVSGRVKKIFVEEGDRVRAGQLIAEIDPQETQLQVDQNSAQVRAAESGAHRQDIEIAQRAVAVRNALDKARSNLRQIKLELGAQPTLTRTAVTASSSAYAAAKQTYDQLVGVTQPNARTAAETTLNDAKNSEATAQNEVRRQESLLDKGYVAQRDVETAKLNLDLARSKVRTAEENLQRLAESQRLDREQANERVNQAKADLDRSQANTIQDTVKREQYLRAVREVSDAENAWRDIAALRASRSQQHWQINQLRSVLSDGQRQLRETRIIAPIDGVVTKKMVQEGELVSSLNSFSAGTTVVVLEDRSKMLCKLNVNEIDTAKLNIGTPVDVKVDAFTDSKFTGKVTKIAPASNAAATGTTTATGDTVVKYEVEVTVEERDERLKSGMSARCTMKVLDRNNVLFLPLDYTGSDDKGDFIMLAPANKKDPKAKGTRQDVKLGAKSATSAEIVSGATEGQEVVKPDYKIPKRQGMMSGPSDGE